MERARHGHYWSVDECCWVAYQQVPEIPVPRTADASAEIAEQAASLDAPAADIR